MQDNHDKILSVQDLCVSFSMNSQIIHALRGISFDLERGATLGIVGESGCGKSTLAKALLKLTPPTSTITGNAYYHNIDLIASSENEMRKIRGKEIGMIFQDPMTSLNPTMKVGKQIVEGYLLHQGKLPRKQKKAYAIELLNLVGIANPEKIIHAYPHTLSGGMRQRVMIALSLACKPKILIADEPTTAVDVTIQAQILALLKEIQKKLNTSMILITHDLSVIANFCHRVIVIYAGKIVETAPVVELFASPKHPYTRRLLQSLPRLDQEQNTPLTPIAGSPPSLISPPQGCAFCARCDQAMNICAKEDPTLVSLAPGCFSACHLYHREQGKQ
jgi:oligopeptide transport system ATP-binding protein